MEFVGGSFSTIIVKHSGEFKLLIPDVTWYRNAISTNKFRCYYRDTENNTRTCGGKETSLQYTQLSSELEFKNVSCILEKDFIQF